MLTPDQRSRLHAAMVGVFPDLLDLRRFMSMRLDFKLSREIDSSNLADAVFEIIERFEPANRPETSIDRLVVALADQFPANPTLAGMPGELGVSETDEAQIRSRLGPQSQPGPASGGAASSAGDDGGGGGTGSTNVAQWLVGVGTLLAAVAALLQIFLPDGISGLFDDSAASSTSSTTTTSTTTSPTTSTTSTSVTTSTLPSLVGPEEVIATQLDSYRVRVSWDAAGTDATSYQVFDSGSLIESTPSTQRMVEVDVRDLGDTVSALVTGVRHCFNVRALSPTAASADTTGCVFVVGRAPTSPEGLEQRTYECGTPTWYWDDTSTDEDGFIVEVDRYTDFRNSGGVLVDQWTYDSNSDPGFFPGPTSFCPLSEYDPELVHVVRVKAYNMFGESEPSNEEEFLDF